MPETDGNTALKETTQNQTDETNTGDKKTKVKNNLIVLTTKPISDTELRDRLNKQFGQNNMYYKILKEAVDNLTAKHKENTKNLMTLIKEGVNPDFHINDGKITSVSFKKALSDNELENYVTIIPVEMYFINDYMEGKALDMELAEHMKDFNITEEILRIQGGTEKERLRAAEYNSMIPIFTSIIKNRVYYNLKNEIDAANRVFEALKKVMSARIEEKKVFARDNNVGGNQRKNY